MSFLARIKNSKKNAGETGQSPATDHGASFNVSIPPKSSSVDSPHHTTTIHQGGSMFYGMNFGEGASGASEIAGDSSVSEASFSGQMDGPTTGEGGDASAAEESGFSFIKDEGPAPASVGDREDGESAKTPTESLFAFLTATDVRAQTQESGASDSSKPPQECQQSQDVAGDQPTAQRQSISSTPADEALAAQVSDQPESSVPTTDPPTLTQVTPRKKKKAKRPGHGRPDAAEAAATIPANTSPAISRNNTSSRENVSQLHGGLQAQESPGSGEGLEGTVPSTGPCVGDGLSAPHNSATGEKYMVATDAGTAHQPTMESAVAQPVALAPSASLPDSQVSTEEQRSTSVSELDSCAETAGESERSAGVDGGNEEADGMSHQSGVEVSDALSQVADGELNIADVSEVVETPVATLPVVPSTATQGEAEVTSEQLALRLQSEALPLTSIESDLKSIEDAVIAILSSQRAKQARRLSKRCATVELRKLQASAIAQENYEEAEQLNAKLKDASDQLTSISSALPSEKMISLSCERDDLFQSRCSVRRDSVACIELLLKEQQDEADTHKRRSAADLARQRQETSAQRAAIERDQSHLDVDWELSRRNNENLQDVEQEKTKEFKDKRDVLSSQLELVNDEIAELEERLMSLRKKAAGLNSDIESEDCKIATVRLEMAEQRLTLFEQKEELQGQQNKIDMRQAELEALERKTEECALVAGTCQNKFKDAVSQMSQLIADRKGALESSCDDTESIKSFIALAEQQRQDMENSVSLTERKKALTAKETETDAVTRKLVVSQKKTASLRKRLDSVANQALDVSAAKKLAVSGRSFREAQRLKQDEELLASEQSGLTLALDEEVQKCVEFNPLLKNLQEQLDTLRQDYLQAEDKSDMEAVSNIYAYRDRLQQMLSSGTPSAFQALLINTELSFCKTVCAELLVKHGKPVDLSGLLEDEEGGNGADIDECPPVLEQSPRQSIAASDSEQRKPLETQIAALEDELQAAIDKEEYDRAEEMNTELTALRSQLASLP